MLVVYDNRIFFDIVNFLSDVQSNPKQYRFNFPRALIYYLNFLFLCLLVFVLFFIYRKSCLFCFKILLKYMYILKVTMLYTC